MLTFLAELVLLPAGVAVGFFLDNAHAAIPVYQLLVTLVVMVAMAAAYTEATRH